MPQSPLPRVKPFDVRGIGPRATAYILICMMTLTLASGFVIHRSLTNLIKVDDDALISSKSDFVIETLSRDDSDANVREVTTQQRVPVSLRKRVYVTIYDQAGHYVASNVKLETYDGFLGPELAESVMNNRGDIPTEIETEHGRVYSYRVLSLVTPRHAWNIVFSVDHDLEQGLITALRRMFFGSLGIVLVFALFLAYIVTSTVLRPLKRLSEHVSEIVQPPVGNAMISPDEYPIDFEELIAAYNRMLRRIDESFRRLSAFSSDIAHELRTPVNNMLGELQVALTKPRERDEYRQVMYSNMEEVQRIQEIINSLLLLARNEAGGLPSVQNVDINRELALISDFYSGVASEKHIHIQVACAEGVYVSAERTLFQQAIGNLLSNAIRYSHEQGVIDIVVTMDVPGRLCDIQVRDYGAGISAKHLIYIFDRFYRGDESRNAASGGVGLGLAIVKSIVERHGGSVSVESTPNVSTTFTVHWPL